MLDIFALQDDIAEAVAGAIEPELLKKEGQRGAEHPQNLTAWDLVRRGVWEFNKFQQASHMVARDLFARAIEVEPASPDGYIWLARAETGIASYDWVADPEATTKQGDGGCAQGCSTRRAQPVFALRRGSIARLCWSI